MLMLVGFKETHVAPSYNILGIHHHTPVILQGIPQLGGNTCYIFEPNFATSVHS